MRLAAREAGIPSCPEIPTSSIAAGFSQAATQYDAIAKVQHRIAQHARQYVLPDASSAILDVGCGTGIHTAWFKQKGLSPVGVDLAEGMIRVARGRSLDIPFILADACRLPFNSGFFSQVFSSMALQWCNDINAPLAEINRVLKTGGRATIAVMAAGSFTELDKARVAAGLIPATNNMCDHEQWREAARCSGFTVAHEESRPYIDYFAHVLPLMRSIARIGAGTVTDEQPRPVLSKGDIRRLQLAYLQQADESGRLPLTYRVSHLVLEK